MTVSFNLLCSNYHNTAFMFPSLLIPHNKDYYLEVVDVDPAVVGIHTHGHRVSLRLDHTHASARVLGVIRVVEVQDLKVLTIMKVALTISIPDEIIQT